MQNTNDRTHLLELRKRLDIEQFDTEAHDICLRAYKQVLESISVGDRHQTKIDRSDLECIPEYQRWRSSGSSLLLIHGCNHSSVLDRDDSWLTPVALNLIQELQSRHEVVSYRINHGQYRHIPIMKLLICQILEWHPIILRDGTILRHIISHLATPRRGAIADTSLSELLIRIVDKCPEPVHIIIDRPEVPRKSMGGFISALLEVVKDATNTVRVLVVVRADFWDVEKNQYDVDMDGVTDRMFMKVRKDQEWEVVMH